jgi:hypothetical protein
MTITVYWNTNEERGEELAASRVRARTQEAIVLALFQKQRGFSLSPDDVWTGLGWGVLGIPLTSVRRAITNLANAGKLRKTEEMRTGSYGKRTHTWVLSDPGDISGA